MARIALTFDDGPSIYTDRILDILYEHSIQATFFFVGSRVLNSEQKGSVWMRGHEIGNHTWSHANLSEIPPSEVRDEIYYAQYILNNAPKFIRPPGGAYNGRTQQEIANHNLKLAMWTINSKDWEGISADEIYQNVLSNPQSGDIVLLHDYADMEIPSDEMLKALPRIIVALKEKGFGFQTLSQMYGI